MQYSIYEGFFSDVEKKLNRIGKKCAKYGNPFIFNVIGEEIREIKDEETNVIKYCKFILVEVDGTAKINNYECVAVIENHNNGNIIRRINTEIDIPKRFMNTDNICEHCNSKRRRNELYVIHNTETNEFKQVGSNCLMLYTNGLNAEYVANYIDGITELEEYNGVVYGGGKSYYPVKDVLSYAVEIIDKMGYFNSSSYCPTKNLVCDMTVYNFDKAIEFINKVLRDNHFNIAFDKNDFFKDNTEEKVNDIINYYISLENDNEFVNNVQVILKEEYVTIKNIGYLCYLPQGYTKYIEKENEKEKQYKENKKSEYYGEIGKRYKDIKIDTFERVASYETMYGLMYVYKIVLETGNILTWKTSKWFDEDEEEKVNSITFTVKTFEDYKGTKQTDVTRCKLNIKN